MRKLRAFTFALSAAVLVTSVPLALAGPHNKGYYACNGKTDGMKYWRYLKKRSDAQETAFKQAVKNRAGTGGCSTVSYPDTEPTGGTEI